MDRDTEEALCDLQAQVCVLRLALRALVRTHPDPNAALASWRAALTEAATSNPVVPSYARSSAHVADRCQAFAEDWTAELIENAVPTGPG
jgi:hypothetical protein